MLTHMWGLGNQSVAQQNYAFFQPPIRDLYITLITAESASFKHTTASCSTSTYNTNIFYAVLVASCHSCRRRSFRQNVIVRCSKPKISRKPTLGLNIQLYPSINPRRPPPNRFSEAVYPFDRRCVKALILVPWRTSSLNAR